MKHFIFILGSVLIGHLAFCQSLPLNFNLVSDPGFENYKYIGSDTGFKFTCWTKANFTPLYNGPAYFNFFTKSRPLNGKKMMSVEQGIYKIKANPYSYIFNDSDTIYNQQSYPQTKLLEPLVAGQKYYLSVWAGGYKDTRNDKSAPVVLISNLGAIFTNNLIAEYSSSDYGKLSLSQSVDLSNWTLPLSDTFIYVKVRAEYIATGGERYMTIGNFDAAKDFRYIFSKNDNSSEYRDFFVAIDDISLVRDTTQPMISLDHFSLGNDTAICNGDTLRIGGEPHFFGYKWNTGDTSRFITINAPGTYWCSADFGCNTVTDTIVVSGSVAPASFNIEDTALCEAQLPVSISAPYTAAAYLWSNGSTAFGTNFNSVGQQWLRISNVCGDKHYTDTFYITSLNVALNNISLGNDTSNCLYGFFLDTITLQVPANNSTQIKWSTGSDDNFIKVQEPGVYWVQVSNVCYSVADTINITGCAVRDVPKVDIPNAFTPNGDGKNDVFRLKYLPQQVVSFNLKIYNRYGQMVSELKSRNDEWDGGEYELGVYYYLFVYKDITGKEYTQKGDISLVR